jgi:hypothetical protein
VPGLIVGLVIGAFAGAFITPLLDGGLKSPMLNSGPTAPKHGRGDSRERQAEPNGDADGASESPAPAEPSKEEPAKDGATPPTGGH